MIGGFGHVIVFTGLGLAAGADLLSSTAFSAARFLIVGMMDE